MPTLRYHAAWFLPVGDHFNAQALAAAELISMTKLSVAELAMKVRLRGILRTRNSLSPNPACHWLLVT